MGVFRITYVKDGHRGRSAKHYIEFRDASGTHGVRRRVPAYKDRKESKQLLDFVERLVSLRRNKGHPDARDLHAIEGLPGRVRARLVEWGVLDKQIGGDGKTIAEHLLEYRQVLEARGVSPRWAELVYGRAKRVFDAAGCKFLPEITLDKITVALDQVRQAGQLSNWSHNHGVAACKSFTRWATPERMNLDPLAKLRGRSRAERVHQRRALSGAEAARLVEAAEAGPVAWGVPGPERALIYRLALETGLRANEIRTLTRSAFNLAAPQPAVTVCARHAKNRRSATLPLRPVLAGMLRAHLAHKLPAAPAFEMPASAHTAEMIRVDLAAAGVEYWTDQGVADFHALRHTFITNLAQAGVMPNVAKELARHSTITLTMDYYTHTRLGDNAAAVALLPDLDSAKQAARLA